MIETESIVDVAEEEEYEFPDGWRWAKLGSLCRFIRGVSFDKSEVRTTPLPRDVPILRGGNIQSELEIETDLIWVNENKVNDVQYLKKNDIAICMSSGSPSVIGKTAPLKKAFRGSVGAFCGIVRPNELIDHQYLYFWFQSHEFLRWRDLQTRGANIQNLRFSELEKIQMALPATLAEQQRIAARLAEQLAAVDRARVAAEAQLATARALPAAFLREVFESEEAQGWKVTTIGEVCQQIDYGYTASADHTISSPKFLRITDIQGGIVNWELVPGCVISGSEEAKNTLLDGDIVFARTGGTTGKSYLISNPPRAVFASYLIRLRANERVLPSFLYYFFQSDLYWSQVWSAARGGAQPNVNASLLSEITFPLPALAEQQRIASTLTEQMAGADQTCAAITARLDAINRLPTVLLRRAFTGGDTGDGSAGA